MGLDVEQNIFICITLSAIGGILEVFATVVLAYPDAKKKELVERKKREKQLLVLQKQCHDDQEHDNDDDDDSQKKKRRKTSMMSMVTWDHPHLMKMCLVLNIVLQVSASMVGNLLAPWYGPVSIVGPTFLSAQLVANMIVYGSLLGLENFTKDMRIGTCVIVTAAMLLPVVGPGVQQGQDVEELLTQWYSYAWNAALVFGMLVTGIILTIRSLSLKCQLNSIPMRYLVLLIARGTSFAINLSFSKVFALGPPKVFFIVSIILKVVSGAIMTGSIVIQSTAVSQNTFVPLNATTLIFINALTGVIVWEDWRVVTSWLGYATVFIQLIVGNYLLLGEIDMFGSENRRYGRRLMLSRISREAHLFRDLETSQDDDENNSDQNKDTNDDEDEYEDDDNYAYDNENMDMYDDQQQGGTYDQTCDSEDFLMDVEAGRPPSTSSNYPIPTTGVLAEDSSPFAHTGSSSKSWIPDNVADAWLASGNATAVVEVSDDDDNSKSTTDDTKLSIEEDADASDSHEPTITKPQNVDKPLTITTPATTEYASSSTTHSSPAVAPVRVDSMPKSPGPFDPASPTEPVQLPEEHASLMIPQLPASPTSSPQPLENRRKSSSGETGRLQMPSRRPDSRTALQQQNHKQMSMRAPASRRNQPFHRQQLPPRPQQQHPNTPPGGSRKRASTTGDAHDIIQAQLLQQRSYRHPPNTMPGVERPPSLAASCGVMGHAAAAASVAAEHRRIQSMGVVEQHSFRRSARHNHHHHHHNNDVAFSPRKEAWGQVFGVDPVWLERRSSTRKMESILERHLR